MNTPFLLSILLASSCAYRNETNGTSISNGTFESVSINESRIDNGVGEIIHMNKNYAIKTHDTVLTRKNNGKKYWDKTVGIEDDIDMIRRDNLKETEDTDEHVYSDKFIMKTVLSQPDVEYIAARNGFELKKKVLDDFYLLKRKGAVPKTSKKKITLPANATLKKHPMIEFFEQEKYLKIFKRQAGGDAFSARTAQRNRQAPVITDDHWKDMWYLHNDTRPSMGIYEAWSQGYTGRGVTIAFLDDGVDTRHKDLMANFRSDLSYNFNWDRLSPEHSFSDNGHGTSCAGIVSAVKNNLCILGVAYNSRFAAIKILDDNLEITASDQAMALNRHYDIMDIYSNSWGPSDDGDDFSAPSEISEKALITGVFKGRNGKGSIFVFASGNGGKNDDDCNCDGFSNSIYTITINSISDTGKPAYYAETCTAVLATTYGGDHPNPMLVTTNRSNTCTKEFQGTSASAPVATGIIALTLEANPDLTWRDVQHLIVETSSHTGLRDPEGFTYNSAGKQVSRYHGFGLMNAINMISRALSWRTVPDQIYSRTRMIYPSTSRGFTITSSARISTTIKYIEHVTVYVYFKSSTRGHATFSLTSPSGTTSKLLGERRKDTTYMYYFMPFTFSSVHTWGEDPSGTWTLRMTSTGYSGSYGGSCLKGNKCTSAYHCCDEDLELCFDKSKATCVEDVLKTTKNPWEYWLGGDDGDDRGNSGVASFHHPWMSIFVLTFFVRFLL